jgi:hypothetical protein
MLSNADSFVKMLRLSEGLIAEAEQIARCYSAAIAKATTRFG